MVVVKWSVSLPRQSEFETPWSLQCFCRICVWKDRKYTKRCQVGPFKKDVNYIGSRIWVTQWVNKKYLVTLWTTKPSHQTCDIMLVQLRKLVQQAIINTHIRYSIPDVEKQSFHQHQRMSRKIKRSVTSGQSY